MKLPLILILLFLSFLSCKKDEKYPKYDQFGNRIIYNPEMEVALYSTSNKIKERHIFIDTMCINQKEKAIQDIKQKRFTYFIRYSPNETEFRAALNKYNIAVENSTDYVGSIRSAFEDGCYEKEMMYELNKRYTEKFFDSIWNATLIYHTKKNPEEIWKEGDSIAKLKDFYKYFLR